MLNLYIKVGPSTPRGGEMFNEAMAVAGDIKGIRGNWMNSADLGDNFNAYKAARGKGYSPEDAALNHTFTGHMAKKQGFTKVNVAVDTDEKVVVEFTRE